MNKKEMNPMLWLFITNVMISSFTFGGGYIIITMIRKYFMSEKGYFNEDELLEMSAISQSSPGAIAVNISALAGYRIQGYKGAIISCLGAVLPPIVLLSLISMSYVAFRSNQYVNAALKGMEVGVAVLMVQIIYDLIKGLIDRKQQFLVLLVGLAYFLSYFMGIHVFIVLILCGVLCLLRYTFEGKRES